MVGWLVGWLVVVVVAAAVVVVVVSAAAAVVAVAVGGSLGCSLELHQVKRSGLVIVMVVAAAT